MQPIGCKGVGLNNLGDLFLSPAALFFWHLDGVPRLFLIVFLSETAPLRGAPFQLFSCASVPRETILGVP